MACKDCENSNPITPIYSPGKYVLNPNCANPECPSVYIPETSGGIGSHELIEGDDILIQDFSDANTLRHKISYNPYISLTVSLAVQAYVSSVLHSLPILKGKVVDELRSTWSYNKTITSQTLNEGSGAASVPVADRNKTTTGLTISANTNVQITGNDGSGKVGGIASATSTVTFGNYMIWGDYTQMIGQPSSGVNALISNLANKNQQIKTSRANSIYATGDADRYFFVIYPASWGLATFKKGIFEGGFVRLKSVNGSLATFVPDGEVEVPIQWTNEEGYTEEIYVYQTLYDNTSDPLEPIVIS